MRSSTSRRDAPFATFTDQAGPALLRIAWFLTGDVDHAQELTQAALIKTYLAWPRLRDVNNAEAYTRRAITTTAIGWWRRKSWRAERPNDDVPDRAAAGDDATARIWLWRELQKLPPRPRAALVLRYYEDLTEPQTAEILGCSVGTVKSQVSDALKKLRTRLGSDVVLKAGMTE